MNERHTALIVEDDSEIVEELQQILLSIDCDSFVVDSSEDALVALEKGTFCLILLDLQIKGAADAIKGHPEHGRALLRKIREEHHEHNGTAFWLPVLIVSGFARERDEAVGVMKDGASDVIHKPFQSRQVSERIRQAFEDSDRQMHERCHESPQTPSLNLKHEIVIAIPGDRIRRRTRITIASKPVDLADSSLKVLLHLMVGKGKAESVHKVDLGATREQGFKGISILRNELKGALGDVDIIENDYQGNYSFMDSVTIGECAIDKLLKIGDKQISELAKQLQNQAPSRKNQSEGNSEEFPTHRHRRQK